MKKAALHNLGCKVNAYETEAMQEMLEKAGYEIVPFKEGADLYVINTCTVTNIADRKSRQMLHRARKMNPDAVVVAAGCYVQAKEKEIQVDDCIDIVLGNNKKQNLIEALEEYERTHNADCNVTESEKNAKNQENDRKAEIKMEEIGKTKEYENLHLTKPGDHTRAYIKVQDGCNQFCTYCIIPYARGRVRSRSMEDVLDEVRTLADNGYKEVVLTGIHLSSYGIDFDKEYHLLELIRAVHEIDGIETGKMIRQMDKNVEIVYCTSSSDFAIAAYEVHAMGYLLKPYEPGRIGAVIDYYVQKHPQKNQNYIEVKSRRKSLIIPYKDIINMESDNKVVYIYTTTQGIVKVYNKLDVFEKELSDDRFLRCHQSYLVNMQYVAGLVDSDFIMINDKMIPIRKSGRKLIVKKYEEFFKESLKQT